LAQYRRKKSATIVATDKSPRPDPIVNNVGTTLNFPALPETLMTNLSPNALMSILCIVPLTSNFSANLKKYTIKSIINTYKTCQRQVYLKLNPDAAELILNGKSKRLKL
jgi:hypothetical protein